MTLTVGSLFSGIGGLDLGLERAGHKVIWQSEIEPYACKVLARHWPTVPNLGDITTVDWTQVERPDILCGGYPCQPFSVAGRRQGSDDPRHLWPAMRDSVRILRPRYVIGENVRGHLSLGFYEVLQDLSSLGYDAEWDIVSAASVGAPHIRQRLFWVAYPNDQGPQGRDRGAEGRATPFSESDSCDPLGYWSASSEPRILGVAYGFPGAMGALRSYGNAVVPQVAELIGRLIL